MKKELYSLRIMFITSLFLIGCGGNNSNDNKNKNIKDKKSKIIMKEVISKENNNVINSKKVIHYDPNGKITEETYFNKENKIESSDQYLYNKLGDKVEWKKINNESKLSQKTEYIYDSNRNLVQEIQSVYSNYKDNPDVSNTFYKYDSKGRIKTAEFENSFTSRHEYIYDQNNKLIKMIYYNQDGSKDIDLFDEHGNKKSDKNNSYKYDIKNNLIEEIHDYPYGFTKFTIEYKFNELGNWIERKTYYSERKTELGELQTIERKTISYYP